MDYNDFTKVEGGIFAPAEFSSNGASCGMIEMGLLYSKTPCRAVAVFTENMFVSESLKLTNKRINKGKINAVLFNNGNSNSCVSNGYTDAETITEKVANSLKINPKNVIISSSGLVGISLKTDRINTDIPELCKGLGTSEHTLFDRSLCDDKQSVIANSACSYKLSNFVCKTGAVIKKTEKPLGDVNSFTCVITTDACIDKRLMKRALEKVYPITVGRLESECRSTSDITLLLSSGFAGNPKVRFENKDYEVFMNSLYFVLSEAYKELMKNRGKKLIEWVCVRAENEKIAENTVNRLSTKNVSSVFTDIIFSDLITVIGSVKGIPNIAKIDISLKTSDEIEKIVNKGKYADFNALKIEEMLKNEEVKFVIDFNSGDSNAVAWSSF